ncbi:MAG: hypothetical protein IT517_14470 [Burkholderiales bacterium]|nr:hypothetical protein [Burkholderiales bacterium]
MDRDTAIAVARMALTLAIVSADAQAQVACTAFPAGSSVGRDLFCNRPSATPRGFDCDQSGCHAGASRTNDVNKIHNASLTAIQNALASVPAMQAQFPPGSEPSDSQIDQIAAFIASWFSTTPPPPPPPGGGGTPPPPPPPGGGTTPPPPTSTMVEYFHAAFGHYFVTSSAAEIDAIDSGRFAGWERTGRSFKAYSSSNGFVTGVCRFFTVAFPPKSSHFYTSNTAECQGLQANNRDWSFEAVAFWVQSADANTGSCPTGTQAVYRLYNNGQSGAPNHRYTTDPAIRADMMAKGWVPEGFGAEGVAFCAPN